MRVCVIAKACPADFTSSDAIYHVPLSIARRDELVLISTKSVKGRSLGEALTEEIVVPAGRFWSWKVFKELKRGHFAKRIKCVLTGIDESSMLAGLLAQTFLGIRWIAVCEDHPYQTRYHEASFAKRIERWGRTWVLRLILRFPQRVVFFIHPGVLDFLWIAERKKALLRNSADLEVIGPIRERWEKEQEQKHKQDCGEPVVSYIGLINETKGGVYMLDVFRQVLAKRPDARLKLIGRIEQGFEERLMDLIKEYAIEKNVELTGLLSAEDALRAALESTVCIHAYQPLPWLYWNQVLKICEYFALGKAVVSVDYPGTRDLIEDEKNGLLVPYGESEKMADAVLKVIEDGELRERIERGALKRASALSWDETEKKLFKIIDECAGERN